MKSEVEDKPSPIEQTARQVSARCVDLTESVTKLEALPGQKGLGEPVATPTPSAPPATGFPEYTEIRGLLAEVAAKGKFTEVKALLQSYGCSKLSQVDVRFYRELLEKARELLSSVQSKRRPAIWET